MGHPVVIQKLSSGVPGLDEVLGGGIPELSFNLIVGSPGCGKTTLGQQIMFANASLERKAVFFSVLGEPPVKMLRYQQQFAFFDETKVQDAIRFVHLGEEALSGGIESVLAKIVAEVDATSPAYVFVDSFRSVVKKTLSEARGELALQSAMQRLALHLTSCGATTFLLGEYRDDEHDDVISTVADGVVRLYQSVERNSMVRKLQVVKIRGQGQIPGLHTMRISTTGLTVFPRLPKPAESVPHAYENRRLGSGVEGLDEMLGGGIPAGYSVLVAGPSGAGKTVLSNQFILEGARRGEPGIVAVFEKRPNDYLLSTPHGQELKLLADQKKLEVIYLRPLDLSIDETLVALRESVLRIGAKRAVIDSLSGLELALAPTFREDFRESLYRMLGALTGLGVTVLSTVELEDGYTSLRFSPHGTAFLMDAIVMQRYVEIDGALRRAMSVVKVRASRHSNDLHEYAINSSGLIVVGEVLRGFDGLLSGAPVARSRAPTNETS